MGDKENIFSNGDVPGRKRYSAKKEKFDKIVKQIIKIQDRGEK